MATRILAVVFRIAFKLLRGLAVSTPIVGIIPSIRPMRRRA
jgi:hypothetical protein